MILWPVQFMNCRDNYHPNSLLLVRDVQPVVDRHVEFACGRRTKFHYVLMKVNFSSETSRLCLYLGLSARKNIT